MKRKPWGGFLLTLVLAVCLSLLPTTARAADHSHAVCGTACPDEANHDGHGKAVDFQALALSGLTKEGDEESGYYYTVPAGRYYLSESITLDAPLRVSGDTALCLNGYCILSTTKTESKPVIAINGGTLTLCDCNGSGSSYLLRHGLGSKKWYIVRRDGNITVNGGLITHDDSDTVGRGVELSDGAGFIMYGGTIAGNKSGQAGVGVYAPGGARFVMYGGAVVANVLSESSTGAGVYTAGTTTIGGSASIYSNATISGGKGMGIYCAGGTLELKGSAGVKENGADVNADRNTVINGGGVYVTGGAAVAVGGEAEISGNKANQAGGKGGGVYLDNGSLTLKDRAKITGNWVLAEGSGGVYVGANGRMSISGSVQVTGNVASGIGSVPRNVYLANLPDGYIQVAGGLTADAHIGVTVPDDALSAITDTAGLTVAKAEGTEEEDLAGWIREGSFADDGCGGERYPLRRGADGLYAAFEMHEHEWGYVLDSKGTSISATCSICSRSRGTVTLSGEEEYTYNGSAQGPAAAGDWVQMPETAYARRGGGVSTPIAGCPSDAGAYTASITVVNADDTAVTISKDFVIQPKVLEKDDFDVTLPPKGAVYDGVTDWITYVSVTPKHSLGADGTAAWVVLQKTLNPDYPETSNEQYRYSWIMDGKTIGAGTYAVGAEVRGAANYLDGDVPANREERWTYTVAPADYEYEMPATANLVEGSEVKMLPKGTGIGVNGKAVEGTLEWYTYDVQSNLVEVKQGNLDEVSYVGNSFTLYWKFTATDPNYTAAPKTGSVEFTIVEPYPQDLRIMLVGSNENKTELVKNYEERVFYLNVTNASPGGGDITYFESDDEVAKVEKFGAGSYKVTIKGAGTTTIKVTAAAVRGKYEATTATCTLKVLPREVIFGAQVKDKIYDGTTDAEVEFTLDRVLPGDEVYVIAADTKFATPDVGKNRMVQISNVTLGGANARGYVVNYGASQQRPLANIREKTIWLERVDRADKEYDGSADYTVRGEVFGGLLPGVTLTRGVDYDISGYFPDADADETDQTVNVFVAYNVNENTKNYRLSIPNGKYTFPGWARILKQPHANAAASLDAYYGGSGAADLSGLLVERGTAAVYAVEGDTAILTAYSLGADTVLHAAVVNDRAKIGASATVRVLVTSVNYADYFIDVTVTVSDKENVTISGLTYADKIYDGQAIAPAGTLTVSGDKVPTGELEVRYTGTGGTVYDSTTAPTAAGSYQVTYRVPEGNADYTGSVTYAFAIRKKVVTVKPKNVTITAGEALPAFELEYDGLVGGDTLTAVPAPQFTVYAIDSDTEVLTPTAGSYRICWTNAGAAAFSGAENYEVSTSAVGTLTVTSSGSSGGGSAAPTYPVNTPDKTEGGTVTVNPKNAKKGETVTITVSPKGGYAPETVTVTDANGNELPLTDLGGGKYSFTMPSGTVSVKATFMEDNSLLNFFYDVPNDAYYYEAVKWAVEKGVTNGIGNNLFGPDQTCTRAQIVTFLYRAAGSPEPTGSASFADVSADSYYAKAVAWAVENGITTGVGGDRFAPDDACTRAQVVTFLARAAKAVSDGQAAFTDIPADAYYASAVAWAADNGVTTGVSGGRFAPDSDCTRAQIVTFLYRLYGTPEG